MNTRVWHLAHGRSLELGPVARIMGILNVTPDSFSDGGRYLSPEAALDRALEMRDAGASIIDVGGESTRPGADPVGEAEEQRRVLPVIEALARAGDMLISVDTYRASTASRAVAAGAHIVNDVWGLHKDAALAKVAAEGRAGLVLMHTGRERQKLADPVEDQFAFFTQSLLVAREAGVTNDSIVLDPGFGFGKETVEANLDLMARFTELEALGHPLLVGTSRKRFIGGLTGRAVGERDAGTAATSVALRLKGAALFRVHDVAMNRDALAVADALLARERESRP